MADDGIQLARTATVRFGITSGTHHAVTVRHPNRAIGFFHGHWPAGGEAHSVRVGIAVGKFFERHAKRHGWLGELGGQHLGDASRQRVRAIRVAPLRYVVVLHAHDGEAVIPVRTREGSDAFGVSWHEGRRQFNDYLAPTGEFHQQGLVRCGRSPVCGCAGGQDLRWRGSAGRVRKGKCQQPGQRD